MVNSSADTSFNYFDNINFAPFTDKEVEIIRGTLKK